jgi:hypothetical protein
MKITEFRKLIREEVRKVLKEEESQSIDAAAESAKEIEALLNSTDLEEDNNNQLNEFVWTPQASEGLAQLGSMVGLSPLTAHVILFGGVILAFASANGLVGSMKDKYKMFVQSVKGKRLSRGTNYEEFKKEILAQLKTLPDNQSKYLKGRLTNMLNSIKAKDYNAAGRSAEEIMAKLKSGGVIKEASFEELEQMGNLFIKNPSLKKYITNKDQYGFAIMEVPVDELEWATMMKIKDILAMNNINDGLSIDMDPATKTVDIIRDRT